MNGKPTLDRTNKQNPGIIILMNITVAEFNFLFSPGEIKLMNMQMKFATSIMIPKYFKSIL